MERLIKNSQFGDIKFDEDKIVEFSDGILGFEDLKQFVILDIQEFEPFQWLISIEDPEIAFPIVSPIVVMDNYSPNLSKKEIEYFLGEFEDKDLLLYVIVTIKENLKKVTANLKGPIIINQKSRKGIQVIVEEDYSTVHPLFG
ncbi:flagellar assembly protein FliW [candidate division KSB1 bacterium]|nr:MAG: flagellar assembly protein FliW [candidate division KSB1 bacterium]